MRDALTDGAAPPDTQGPVTKQLLETLLLNGYVPVPLEPRSKKPIANEWQKTTPTLERLTRLLGLQPKANLGIRNGDGGLINIDIDDDELFARLRPHIPDGAPTKFGKRGGGVLVRCPDTLATRNFKNVAGKQVLEVRVAGTQTAIPPSIHPDTRNPYRWLGAATPFNTPAAELPVMTAEQIAELCMIAGTTPYSETALREECACISAAGEGNRNKQLFNSALKVCSLIKDGHITDDAGRDALLRAARQTGLGEAEIVATINSAYDTAKPRDAKLQSRGGGKAATDEAKGLVSRCAADIAPERVEWLWYGRLAKGKQTCIGGEPGAGKSQALISIIATITTGGQWPCGEGNAPVGSVLLLAAEDSAADTLVPRLMAAGADLKRVHIITAATANDGQRSLNLKTDLAVLEAKIAKVGDVVLVAIDPITAYIGDTDGRKNTSVRAVLDPVSDMADRTGVAVLTITHFRKEGGGETTKKALHRFIDSIAFVAGPRACFALMEDPENPKRRLLLTAKANLTAEPAGLAFSIEEVELERGIKATRVAWEAAHVELTADQAIAASERGAELSETRRQILEALHDVDEGMTPKQVEGATGIKYNTVCVQLRRMTKAKQVHDGGGSYWHPDNVPPMADGLGGRTQSQVEKL